MDRLNLQSKRTRVDCPREFPRGNILRAIPFSRRRRYTCWHDRFKVILAIRRRNSGRFLRSFSRAQRDTRARDLSARTVNVRELSARRTWQWFRKKNAIEKDTRAHKDKRNQGTSSLLKSPICILTYVVSHHVHILSRSLPSLPALLDLVRWKMQTLMFHSRGGRELSVRGNFEDTSLTRDEPGKKSANLAVVDGKLSGPSLPDAAWIIAENNWNGRLNLWPDNRAGVARVQRQNYGPDRFCEIYQVTQFFFLTED